MGLIFSLYLWFLFVNPFLNPFIRTYINCKTFYNVTEVLAQKISMEHYLCSLECWPPYNSCELYIYICIYVFMYVCMYVCQTHLSTVQLMIVIPAIEERTTWLCICIFFSTKKTVAMKFLFKVICMTRIGCGMVFRFASKLQKHEKSHSKLLCF